MFLSICLRKEVPDVPTAEALTAIVRNKLADYPEILITSQVSEVIYKPEPPEEPT